MGQVSFWSMVHGQTGNTANAAAVASIIGLEYDLRTLVGQTQFARSNLEGALLREKEKRLGMISGFSDTGIDALERLARAGRLTPEAVKDNAVVLEKNRLDILLGTTKPDEQFYSNMSEVVPTIFRYANEYYHTVILDLHSGKNNPLTNTLLSSSDLICVSLSQNLDLLDEFFSQKDWPDALRGKPIFLVLGQYDQDSKYSAANIRRYIKRKYDASYPLFTVPYNTGFRDAFNDKNVLNWCRKNRNVSKRHPHYFFFQEVRRLARAILEETGINADIKHIESIERGA